MAQNVKHCLQTIICWLWSLHGGMSWSISIVCIHVHDELNLNLLFWLRHGKWDSWRVPLCRVNRLAVKVSWGCLLSAAVSLCFSCLDLKRKGIGNLFGVETVQLGCDSRNSAGNKAVSMPQREKLYRESSGFIWTFSTVGVDRLEGFPPKLDIFIWFGNFLLFVIIDWALLSYMIKLLSDLW